MKRVAIHQPEYFPLLGYLHKASRVDQFVLLDTVQFDRSSLQHRARVIGPNGGIWLTLPFVHRFPQTIGDVQIVDPRWRKKHHTTLQACYGRAPGWRAAAEPLAAFFACEYQSLLEVTSASIRLLFECFRVETPVVRASELSAQGNKSELVLNICREVGATSYLAGRTGAEYLDRDAFSRANIEIEVQSFTPPPYPTHRPTPEADQHRVSAVDAWLNAGSDAPALLGATQ